MCASHACAKKAEAWLQHSKPSLWNAQAMLAQKRLKHGFSTPNSRYGVRKPCLRNLKIPPDRGFSTPNPRYVRKPCLRNLKIPPDRGFSTPNPRYVRKPCLRKLLKHGFSTPKSR